MMFGIDVSVWQGVINFDKVILDKKHPEFIFIKATQGTKLVDSKLTRNATEAKRVGLKIGYYHFVNLNTKDVVKSATAQALHFLKAIHDLPMNDLPLAIDIEKEEIDLNPNEFALFLTTFIDILKGAGRTYCIYSGYYFLNANLPVNHSFGSVPLWHAQYTDATTPRIAKGWQAAFCWQYSSKGSIDGIRGNVDLNRM